MSMHEVLVSQDPQVRFYPGPHIAILDRLFRAMP